MEQFAERLSQLADLSDEDLGALETELVEAFDAADQGGEVDAMQEMADALDQVRAELERRGGGNEAPADAAPAEPVAASGEPAEGSDGATEAPAATDAGETTPTEEPASESAPVNDEPAPEGDPEPKPEGDGETTETQTPEGEEPEGDTKEDGVSDLTADDVSDANKPEAVQAAAPVIRVGGDVPGFTAGAVLDGMDQAIEALTAKVNTMRGVGGDGEHVLVASIRYEDEPGEERTLRMGDAEGNGRKIRQLISDPEQLTAEALVAAGWCAPKAPIYDVPTMGTTDRPVRNGLPSFNADRGGIVWMEPPALPIIEANNDDTFAVWDGNTDKPCFTIPCGTEQDAVLETLTFCLCFENLMSRAFPEWIRANTELTMVAQARWAEQFLLARMWGTLTAQSGGETIGTPNVSLGAARDFLTTLRAVASQFRWARRLSPTQPLQLLAPSWLNEAIAADLSLQAPGDSTLSVSYSEIAGYLSDLNIQPIWYIDDLPVGAGASPDANAASHFDSPIGFPAVAEWLLYPTGSFIRMDGGSLDLGVVRSKEDVQQNKYCEFSETFENVAYMGPASPNGWVTRGQTAVNIIGASPERVDTTGGVLLDPTGS